MNKKELEELYHEQFNRIKKLEAELEMYERDVTFASLAIQLTELESQIDAMRDFMALLYLGILEGRDEAFEALDEKTKRLINEVWFERLEEDE